MNISKQTVELLQKMYVIIFYGDNMEEAMPEKATQLHICWEQGDEMGYIGKTITAPKRMEITVEYVTGVLNRQSVYRSFSEHFNFLIKDEGLNCYPTTYGIGVFDLFGRTEKTKERIDEILNELGIKYENEYSSARWVYRYKISKSIGNIAMIENFINSKK